jgi:hypothetical protein
MKMQNKTKVKANAKEIRELLRMIDDKKNEWQLTELLTDLECVTRLLIDNALPNNNN